MAKKPANKASKTMSKKGMKKTKGGILIGLVKPITISGNMVNGDNKVNGDGITGNITGNTINGGTVNPGTLTNNTWSG